MTQTLGFVFNKLLRAEKKYFPLHFSCWKVGQILGVNYLAAFATSSFLIPQAHKHNTPHSRCVTGTARESTGGQGGNCHHLQREAASIPSLEPRLGLVLVSWVVVMLMDAHTSSPLLG